ncbi:MAG: hypothetical protein IJY39_09820 [Clostridia bacterium]|nr:hypothetical protein [Clostridia bacterium]
MKKNKNMNCADCPCCKEGECAPEKKEKVDVETRIYNILNTAERISVKLAQINQILKKAKKKKKKKVKKLGKVDKKTGTLILKGQKKQKVEKPMKRYKPKKKK